MKNYIGKGSEDSHRHHNVHSFPNQSTLISLNELTQLYLNLFLLHA